MLKLTAEESQDSKLGGRKEAMLHSNAVYKESLTLQLTKAHELERKQVKARCQFLQARVRVMLVLTYISIRWRWCSWPLLPIDSTSLDAIH